MSTRTRVKRLPNEDIESPGPEIQKAIEHLQTRSVASRVVEELDAMEQATSKLSSIHAELLSRYDDTWVAVGPEGLVGSAKTQQTLLSQLRRKGSDTRRLYIRFLSARPLIV